MGLELNKPTQVPTQAAKPVVEAKPTQQSAQQTPAPVPVVLEKPKDKFVPPTAQQAPCTTVPMAKGKEPMPAQQSAQSAPCAQQEAPKPAAKPELPPLVQKK